MSHAPQVPPGSPGGFTVPPGGATPVTGGFPRFLERHPVSGGIAIVAFVFIVPLVVGALSVALFTGMSDAHADAAAATVHKLTAAVFVLAMVIAWRLARTIGLGGPSTWRNLRLFIAPTVLVLVVVVLNLPGTDLSDGGRVLLAAPQPLLIGFWEETLIRGILLALFLKAALARGRGPVLPVLGSAVVFGLLHLINLVGAEDPGGPVTQVVYATLIGIGFGALLVRTRALWILIILHAVIDISIVLKPPDDSTGFSLFAILFFVPLAVYGLWLLRPAGLRHDQAQAH